MVDHLVDTRAAYFLFQKTFDRAQVVRGSDPIESRIPAPQNFSYLMTLPVAKRINLVSQLSSLKTKFHQHIIFYQKIYRFEEDV